MMRPDVGFNFIKPAATVFHYPLRRCLPTFKCINEILGLGLHFTKGCSYFINVTFVSMIKVLLNTQCFAYSSVTLFSDNDL